MDDRNRKPPKLPELPAGAAETIIQAAASISGDPTEGLTLEQAIEILQGDNPNPFVDSLLDQSAARLAGGLADNLTDEQAALLTEAQPQETEPLKRKPKADPGNDPDDRRHVIRVNTPEYDPALDPGTPDFDTGKWKAATAAATAAAEAAARIFDEIQSISNSNWAFVEAICSPAIASITQSVNAMQESLGWISAAIAPTVTGMQSFFNSDEWKNIRETLEEITAVAPAWLELAQEIEQLTPYLDAELKKPEYAGKTIDDLFDEAETDDDGRPTESSLFIRALNAAHAAKEAAAVAAPHTAIKRAEIIEYPLDKPNSIIWNLLERDTKGQIAFNMAKSGSRKNIPAYYAINFDELGDDIQITKRLLPFDKRVYIAVSALFNAGNNIITLSQIYYAMGYTGNPGAKNLTKINDAITKMTGGRIFFDNKKEAETLKGYPRFQYDGSLLPLERGIAVVNGQLADAAIHIFREPPLITFAKQRKQITAVNVKLLQSPVSKTDANLQIDDYLIERISRGKNGRAKSCRILFKTLYDHTGITTKKQEQRAPTKVEKYLQHYQQQGFITRFTLEKDGITVYW